MSVVSDLKALLAKQKTTIAELEREVESIEASDLFVKNQELETKLTKCQESLTKKEIDSTELSEENKKLKTILYEQFYNEKLQALGAAKKRIDIYYRSNYEGEVNRLTNLEISIKKRIDEMAGVLKKNRVNIEDEIFLRLEELKKQTHIKITKAREDIIEQTQAYGQHRNAELSRLKQERVTQEEIRSRANQNNVESLIGLSLVNKLGILLLVIGVITASQYTYFRLPDTMKSIFSFSIGIILLIIGELLNRRKPNVFSLGITGGGVAISYVALSLSYFQFNILGTYPALLLCVFITAGAFVLSQRYNSQTVSIFAMIGGYLPIFSIAGNTTMVYGAMVYFIILNILALVISVNKKWMVTAYIGFFLNFVSCLYISSILLEGNIFSPFFSSDSIIAIVYVLFSFLIYTLIPLSGTYMKKIKFKGGDITLLAFNTFISSVFLYFMFYISDLGKFAGFIALVFSIIYLLSGRFVAKSIKEGKKAAALFYITGITFFILIIPFQFEKMWLSLGWLIEGVALLSYGIYKERKAFKKAGFVISLLCLFSFVLFDITNIYAYLFTFKYFSITLGSIVILATLAYKKNLSGGLIKSFKYCTLINIWLVSLYMLLAELSPWLKERLLESNFNADYLIFAAFLLASYIVAYTIPRIKILNDSGVRAISSFIYMFSLFLFLGLNISSPVSGQLNKVPMIVATIGTIELITITLISLLAMRDLILYFVTSKKLGIEWYPLFISLYFVIILTQNLITQYGLAFNNMVISIIYIVTALLWIIFGFTKRYMLTRRFGLGLSMLSVAKLFLVDLAFSSQGYRILSYFIFGLVFVAISYVYQRFDKKLDAASEVLYDKKTKENTLR
ncbi:MAG: DUF2339 domain-containing protein [Clostridium sp.]|nr:DUF2339 domain-containing protein [Clostridium sp.]